MELSGSSFTASLPTQAIEFRFDDTAGLDYIGGLVRSHGLSNYEQPMPGLLAWMARVSTGFVLDVGANTGLFSLLMAAANPVIKVCAFEPLESVGKLLRANLALNPQLASRISLYEVGLSNAAGSFDFYETINDYGLVTTSSSLELGYAQQVGTYRKQIVNTVTLDGWVTRLVGAKISLMKIDVEGHEYAVIEGGRETIARNRPFITIEVLGNSRVDRINELLFEASYIDLVIAPDALRYCTAIRHHPDGWNHLLCPAEQLGSILHACRELGLRLDVG